MADYGLLGGIAEGFKQGLIAYKGERNRLEDIEKEKQNRDYQKNKDEKDFEMRKQQLEATERARASGEDMEARSKGLIKTATGGFEPDVNSPIYKKQNLGLESDRLGLLKTQAEVDKLKADTIKTRSPQERLTEGQKAVDKDYAKDYNDLTGGGEVSAKNAINKLKSLRNNMSKDKGLIQSGGGPISGSLPDMFRTQKSIAQRDNIVSVANSALKATFGGQLSDGERKALANEFYNDKLSNEENLKVIDRKISELEAGLENQKKKAKYYEDNQSLANYGSQGLIGKSKPQSIKQNGVTYTLNPQTGEYE